MSRLRDRFGPAHPERYLPAHLLRDLLSAARRAGDGDGKAARLVDRACPSPGGRLCRLPGCA
jgi:hypothetical protein